MYSDEKGFKEFAMNKLFSLEIEIAKLKSKMTDEELTQYEIKRFWKIFDEIEKVSDGLATKQKDGSYRFAMKVFNALADRHDLPQVNFLSLYKAMDQQEGALREVIYINPPKGFYFHVKRHTPKGDLNG